MKQIYLAIITTLVMTFSFSQETATLRLTAVEEPETSYGEMRPLVQLGSRKVVAVMGGLNDLDGMNNYFNFYGSKVIVQSKDILSNGIISFTLRREDGDNFYGQYPTLRAELIPNERFNTNWETNSSR